MKIPVTPRSIILSNRIAKRDISAYYLTKKLVTVLICNDVSPPIRGHLKRWFIEPKPNVFVGTLNVRTHHKVMDFILRNASKDFGMLVISTAPNCQGYEVERIGPEGKIGHREVEISGIKLIAESWIDPGNCPF